MVYISKRIRSLNSSPTIAMAERARELRASGKDIIGLSSGEPDFDTPQHIRVAAAEAMERGETRYTDVAGTPALRDAVIRKFSRENGLSFDRNQIIVGTGAKQLIFNALVATLDEGDEVIVPAPYWVSYPDMVHLAGGVCVVADCTTREDLKLTADILRDVITPRTRWLILNSPNNPTGAVYSRDELADLAALLLEHPAINIMSDDIYEHIRFEDTPFATLAQVEPGLADRILTINGVSKAYAMTGWRIGFAGGPADLVGAMVKIQSQTTSNATSIAQAAAVVALDGPQDCVEDGRRVFERRRDLVMNIFAGANRIKSCRPAGAFYMLVDCRDLIGGSAEGSGHFADDEMLVRFFLENANVALVAGSAFGIPGFFRMSCAAGDDVLREAANRIVKASWLIS
ncbi:pyridoxal phosphate-dependent aminotransferase [Aliirhizobium smilacinae]|uniref:Aminotransferase n=1 Tax=Aliirhizobium smilacinae TaxID=1395944 RepID=A0A5C4XJU2_9HYPH|nr:pyridoxal phosphate-dependent aminotransferase [Rhizobium smilacinae]TNM63459.1 pyridoxal phosphate-dependent aminotransferase [Rhizobium smilacinae]